MEFISYIVARIISVFISYFIFRYIPYSHNAANSEFFSDTIRFGCLLLIYTIIYPIILKCMPSYDYETMSTLNFIHCALGITLLATCLFGAAYCIDTLNKSQEDYEE